jgi:glutamate/tyrosine decarboxylase-like PLP-dependent enzyme
MNAGGWRLGPAATEVELNLIRWFAGRFGLRVENAGGMLTSGGAMANFVALKVARDARATWDIRNQGAAAGPRMVLYASEEVHVTTDRAADMLGLGADAARKLPVDGDDRMRVDALREAIVRDRAEGLLPFAVVATAGTVATGAIDPLEEIADVCAAEGLWMHVDGAYGGPAAFVPGLRPLFAGIERADSIAFDPHKWLYTPHSGGCVVMRDWTDLVLSFAAVAGYVHEDKDRTGHGLDLGMMGPQFSRSFASLKVWVSLLAHGWSAYQRRIAHDVELAGYLASLVSDRPEFELMARGPLSICCFRYVPPDLPGGEAGQEYLNELNERVMTELQMDGRAYVSNAIIRGRFVLRACIVNFRTEAKDVEAVLEVAAELGARLDAELRPETLRAAS